MSHNSASKIRAISLDELLGVGSAGQQPQPVENQVVELPLEQLHAFRNHPFEVLDDKKMAETVDSIRKMGILVPGIVRARAEGAYEIIAGHRRCRAAQLAGLTAMPVIIKELSDAEATVIMVDSNIQREDLTYREKAFAYKMKYEALKELGISEEEAGIRLDQVLAEAAGESRNTIQRYLRLTMLLPELLQMVDDKKLGFIAAVDLSYLTEEEQTELLHLIREGGALPSGTQAAQMKEYSKSGRLNRTVMELLLRAEPKAGRVVIKEKQLRDYFPEDYNTRQMTDVILKLLEEWKQHQKQIL